MARCSRRRFLSLSAAAAGAGLTWMPPGAAARTYRANEAVRVGLVGVAGRGDWFVKTMPRLCDVVAVCDVNDRRAEDAYRRLPDAARFHDFRKMLDVMDQRLDAIVVATPDNTHAVISLAAIERGKHVLCEKPLTHDVAEARALREAARRKGVATQMGNQGTASSGFRRAVEHLQDGLLGTVREVFVWKDGGGSGAGLRPPQGEEPVPEFLHWDLWLGPAAWRPFHSAWLRWHAWRDFATGNLGNWAPHAANLPFMALELRSLWQEGGTATIRLRAEVSEVIHHAFPQWEIVRYELPARGELPPLKLTWFNGAAGTKELRAEVESHMERRLDWGDAGEGRWRDHAGCLVVGTEGAMWSIGHNTEFELYPRSKFSDPALFGPQQRLPRSRGHEVEWLEAVRGGPAAMSDFSYSSCLTELMLLGNVATQVDAELHYEPASGRIVNHEQADRLLRRQYRQGW